MKFPIGIQSFEKLVRRGRFGKSLLMSAIAAYFLGLVTELMESKIF